MYKINFWLWKKIDLFIIYLSMKIKWLSNDEMVTYGYCICYIVVKIGNMLAYTALDDKPTSVLITHVQDFLK